MSETFFQARLLDVDVAPIAGTHLHRRYQDGAEVCPEYLGPAQNECAAIAEASAHGYGAVLYAGLVYARIAGQWYVLNWPARRTETE